MKTKVKATDASFEWPTTGRTKHFIGSIFPCHKNINFDLIRTLNRQKSVGYAKEGIYVMQLQAKERQPLFQIIRIFFVCLLIFSHCTKTVLTLD